MKFGLSFSVVVPPDGPLSWSQVAQDMVNLFRALGRAPEVPKNKISKTSVLREHTDNAALCTRHGECAPRAGGGSRGTLLRALGGAPEVP